MSTDIYYRPEWTCGKYNATKHVAIMFNLLMNGEYFFEQESADVVGLILQAGRNGKVSVSKISETLNISSDSIIPFFNSLVGIGLLTEKYPTENDIAEYRKYCVTQPNITTYMGDDAENYLQCDISSVEIAYADSIIDCTEISSVIFELTYRCSEKCLHCYNIGATRNDQEKSGRGDFAELTLDDYKRIIDEMCEAGLVTATLTGGDPFAYKDVWGILEYLYQKDIAVTIQTNGQQLIDNIDKLARFYPRMVRVSLYAGEPAAHDYITRKNGSWQTTIDVIKALKEVCVPVGINCVLMRAGLKSYLKLKKIGEELGAPVLFDCCVTDSIEGDYCATHHLRLTPQELEIVMMDTDAPKDEKLELYANPASYKRGVPCRAGYGMFSVMPDGKLIPCVTMHMVFGDLKVQSFHSIVTNNAMLKHLLETPASDYEECGTHDYCKCCGFCAGISYSRYGTPFKANENNCYIAKCKYSLMKKIQSGEDVLKGKSLQECINEMPDYIFPHLQREYI